MDEKDLHNRIYELMARELAGEASREQLEELDLLLRDLPDFKQLHDQLLLYPQVNPETGTEVTDPAYAAQYVKMMYADQEKPIASIPEGFAVVPGKNFKVLGLKLLGVAAGLALLIIIGKGLLPINGPVIESQVQPTRAFVKSKLILPDGTVVYLNADSHLEYDIDFNVVSRDVVLIGEAFFEVAHNAKMPFVVHTDKATVRVLGTRFNIKNYKNETWEATLLQGKIEMFVNRHPGNKLQLEPSQKVTVTPLTSSKRSAAEDFKVSVSKLTTLDSEVAETAWMTEQLVFVDKSLEDIARDLERSFGISVRFLTDKARNQKYTGTFKKDNLEQILEILNLSNPIDYELKANELVIK